MAGLPLPPAAHRQRHGRGYAARAGRSAHLQAGPTVPGVGVHPPSSIDDLLARARERFTRMTPSTAAELLRQGRIVLVDTRPQYQRDADGSIPGALVIDRNVLEWRLDPASGSRLPNVRDDLPVVVLCNQGYSSSLAAASLLDLGIHRVSDVIGGFQAWKAAGLPTG